MPGAEEVYRLIRQVAPSFAAKLQSAAAASHNETELRTQVAHHIQELADQFGVRLNLREEYTLAEGQADAVYNRLVIEYKTPGVLRADLSHEKTAAAVAQMRRYVDGLAREQRHAAERMLGVAIDGHYLVFARYVQGHWSVEAPLAVTAQSSERLLRALFSLSAGRALIPQNLVEDFGAKSAQAREATRALYHALEGHAEGLPAKLFEQWQIFFGEVSGYDEASVRLRDKKELRAFAEGMGLTPGQVDPPRLLFAIHTYFSFLVKAIARLVLQRQAAGKLAVQSLAQLANLPGVSLRLELEKVERGDVFRVFGLLNLLEGDFFSWYLSAWNERVESALRRVLAELSEYNPSTLEDDPYAARDLLKKLYHYLLPCELRHDLGEYYTPDWLAERVLAQLNEPRYSMPGPLSRPVANLLRPVRLLDPACGSGTFLVLAIRALKEHCRRQEMNEADTLELILQSVVGIDLNPLAVLAARVNYLLAVADLLPEARGPVEIPVYLADSILPPQGGQDLLTLDRRVLKTAVGDLPVPKSIDTRAKMDTLTNLLEEYVHNRFGAEVFVERACAELDIAQGSAQAGVLRELFEKLCELEGKGLDGIWARVLKNAFMPLFLQRFDLVVGNPPWVNWESLPEGYRRESAHLWQEYGLFVHTGMDAILGKGKKDLSTLMSYAVADRFLKDGGKLGFVITQSVFKTAGAGQGFRRFRIGQDGPWLRILAVDDMNELQPFEGAANRTAVFVLQKGERIRYPVQYTYWKKAGGIGLDFDSTLQEAESVTKRLNLEAIPVDPRDATSSWLTARKGTLRVVQRMLGSSDYLGKAGVCTWLNGVYWLRVVGKRPDGLIVVQNITEGAKREVAQVTAEIEPELVYPLLRGRDIARWHAKPRAHLLMVQDPKSRRGIDEGVLQRRYPKTYAYLKRFEAELRSRSGYRRYFAETDPFYSMFDVGSYTFTPYKVVWRGEVAPTLIAAVSAGQDRTCILPDQTAYFVGTQSAAEAHYLCAVLNSLPVRAYYRIRGYKHVSTEFVTCIHVTPFDLDNPLDRRLSELSQRAHALAAELVALPTDAPGGEADKRMNRAREDAIRLSDPTSVDKERRAQLECELVEIEAQVDQAAAELWGITPAELREVQRSLAELSA